MSRIDRILCIALLACSFVACSHKPSTAASERHYPLTGRVVALNAHDHTATIDAAAIPNYMEAMTMEYPVPFKDDFAKLHVGDHVAATVNVRDDGLYSLSNVQSRAPGRK